MIRVAILGAGIGAEHLSAYRKLPELFDVVAICDLDEARARTIANGISVTSSTDDILADASVDLIDICLPPHLHVDMTLRALAAKKHVICEKPIAMSLSDVDRLEAAQRDSGTKVFPVFQYRFGPAMTQLRAAMEAGFATKAYVATFETHWCRTADYYDNPWRGTWAGEQGGALLGHAIHAHDLVTCILGPIALVQARVATRVNDVETEDCAALSFEMKSGALVTSSVSLGAATDRSRITLLFDGMTANSGTSPYAPMSGDWTFEARNPDQQAALDDIIANTPEMAVGFEGYLIEVARAVAGQSNAAVTLDDGRRSVEVVTAAYLAARTGQPQTLPLGNDHPLYTGWQPHK